MRNAPSNPFNQSTPKNHFFGTFLAKISLFGLFSILPFFRVAQALAMDQHQPHRLAPTPSVIVGNRPPQTQQVIGFKRTRETKESQEARQNRDYQLALKKAKKDTEYNLKLDKLRDKYQLELKKSFNRSNSDIDFSKTSFFVTVDKKNITENPGLLETEIDTLGLEDQTSSFLREENIKTVKQLLDEQKTKFVPLFKTNRTYDKITYEKDIKLALIKLGVLKITPKERKFRGKEITKDTSLNQDIKELGLSKELCKKLKDQQISTIGCLLTKTKEEVQTLTGINYISIRRIFDSLTIYKEKFTPGTNSSAHQMEPSKAQLGISDFSKKSIQPLMRQAQNPTENQGNLGLWNGLEFDDLDDLDFASLHGLEFDDLDDLDLEKTESDDINHFTENQTTHDLDDSVINSGVNKTETKVVAFVISIKKIKNSSDESIDVLNLSEGTCSTLKAKGINTVKQIFNESLTHMKKLKDFEPEVRREVRDRLAEFGFLIRQERLTQKKLSNLERHDCLKKWNRDAFFPFMIKSPQIQNMAVGELKISEHIFYRLVNNGIYTVGDILKKTKHQLLNIPKLGKISFGEIVDVLIELSSRDQIPSSITALETTAESALLQAQSRNFDPALYKDSEGRAALIETLDFSKPTESCLKGHNIKFVSQLLNLVSESKTDLFLDHIQQLNKKSRNEIKKKLAELKVLETDSKRSSAH